MSSRYNAADIEVLTGLEPVQRRPGMYTDTTRPNHLAQEVIDNSVDEALAGHASQVDVIVHDDGSVEVSDDGRGMPVDIHPDEGISGVELIMTRLHAGGKFSDRNYSFAGGLHGVGVSVVNALSSRVEVGIRRDGSEYRMCFAHGAPVSPLQQVGSVPKKNTGTTLRFWPEPKYFDTPRFALPKLRHLLRAKAVLCAGLTVTLLDETSGEREQWRYQDGLADYLRGALAGLEHLPPGLFAHQAKRADSQLDLVLAWLPEGELVQESYVNLIPTTQGGTHVNGLRSGLTSALREFCELRNLLPRGLKLAPEDIWERVTYVLSLRMKDPQFAGQTKERLSSRDAAGLVEGDSAGGSAKQARDREFQAILPLRGKILNTWEVESGAVLASQEVHDLAVAIGCDPGVDSIESLRYGKIIILADADSDGLHIATLLSALFVRHFPALVRDGHVFVAMPPLFRVDVGKQMFYCLDEDEKRALLERIGREKMRGAVSVTRFKGLGEMNPGQLRESTIHPDTRRLVQLTLDDAAATASLMDMLLAKKRAGERKTWLERKGDLASLEA